MIQAQKNKFRGHYYAHRGLHTPDHSIPENSLPAFAAAVEAGYGIELDVQLSRDGCVVVFHDDTLDRVCQVSGKVCDRTYGELQELLLCNTAEHIPLFAEVLSEIDGKVPLIVELKTGHRNRELCQKTLALLLPYLSAHPDTVCIESFDPFIVSWFRFHAPTLMRGQLAMPFKRYRKTMPILMRYMMSRNLFHFLTAPHFIAYRIDKAPLAIRIARKCGVLDAAWTSHRESDHIGRDMVIFEFYRPEPTFDKFR